MKKEYTKPYLALESFQLVAALAGSCGNEGQHPLNHGIDTCDRVDQGDYLFGAACEDNVHNNPEECYQGPIEGGLYLAS